MSLFRKLIHEGFSDESLPDSLEEGEGLFPIDPEFVISRDKQGRVISHYKDPIWDLRVYDPRYTAKANFSNHAHEIQEELKQAMFGRLFLSVFGERAVSSIRLTELNQLARLATNNHATIRQVLNDDRFYPYLISSFSNLSNRQQKDFLKVLRELWMIRVHQADFMIAPPNLALIEKLEKIYNAIPKATKQQLAEERQTPVIPSRIYAVIIAQFHRNLDEFLSHYQGIVDFYQHADSASEENPNWFQINIAKPDKKASSDQHWRSYLNNFSLVPLYDIYGFKNKKQLNAYVRQRQEEARYWINLFTGMRLNEAATLPYKALDKVTVEHSDVWVLNGYTSKSLGQNLTPTYWLTSDIIEIGVKVAQKIADLYATRCAWDNSDLNLYPLFPASQKTSSFDPETAPFPGAPTISKLDSDAKKQWLNRFPELVVTEDDYHELEQFDGFRDWKNTVMVGKPWPLSSHQARRSLAVYSARSGLVSIGTLKLQLKHLFETMSSWYRRGSEFAKHFILDEDQSLLVDELEHESRVWAFTQFEEFIDGANRLFGGEGARIQAARDKGQPLVIDANREFTRDRFMSGEISFKEGPLGGCSKVGKCDKLSITRLVPCLGCEDAIQDDIVTPKKVEQYLNVLNKRLSFHTEGSLDYEAVLSYIAELESFKNHKLGATNG